MDDKQLNEKSTAALIEKVKAEIQTDTAADRIAQSIGENTGS